MMGAALTGMGEATTGANGAVGALDMSATCDADVAVVVLVGFGAEVFLVIFFIRFTWFSFSSFLCKLANARQRWSSVHGETPHSAGQKLWPCQGWSASGGHVAGSATDQPRAIVQIRRALSTSRPNEAVL